MIEITEETTFAQIHEYMRNELMTEAEQIAFIEKIYYDDPLLFFTFTVETDLQLEEYHAYLKRKLQC